VHHRCHTASADILLMPPPPPQPVMMDRRAATTDDSMAAFDACIQSINQSITRTYYGA